MEPRNTKANKTPHPYFYLTKSEIPTANSWRLKRLSMENDLKTNQMTQPTNQIKTVDHLKKEIPGETLMI